VDPEFFEMFPYYRWKEGLPEMFKAKDAVVLGESMARQMADRSGIGIADLIGKSLKVRERELQIVGVIQDFENSILPRVDLLANILSEPRAENGKSFNSIGSYMTLCRVRDGVDRADFETKLQSLVEKNYMPLWGDQIKGWRIWRFDEIFWDSNAESNGFSRLATSRWSAC
jgi:hypothetical protein